MTIQNKNNFFNGSIDEQILERFQPIFNKIAESALTREVSRILPYEPIQWLKEAGFGAVRVPKQFGGDGLSQKQLFQLLIKLAIADSNVVQALRGHFAFVEDRLNAHALKSQELWFKRFVEGQIVGNGWTEIGSVKIGDVITRVTQNKSNHLVVNGKKYYSTGTIFADWIDLFALDETTNQHVIAVVSTKEVGVDISDDWNGFGQKTTGSGTLELKNVPVSHDNVLPFQSRFKYQAAFYQTVHLATLAGIAQNAVNVFSTEVKQRTRIYSHANASLAQHDAQILQVIGKASAQAYAAKAIVAQVAEALDIVYASFVAKSDVVLENELNDRAELEASQGQAVISELVLTLTTELFNALGASASATNKQLDRFWRNARVVSSHNPIVYKQKVIGDWLINQTPLPYVWQIGNSPVENTLNT